MSKTKRIVKITTLVLSITLIFTILGGFLYAYFATKDINLGKNGLPLSINDLIILDACGNELEFDSKLVRAVDYKDISPYAINAFVALEDKRFYEHSGLDYIRIASAGFNNIKAGYFKEGGSTITQQLAKNVVLTQEKTIQRKLEEAKLAIQIERRYTKDEIITMYLNTIYFGHSLYGIAAASERLFNKKTNELSISEAAMLAGIVKNPLKNSPLNSVENAIERRNLVLKLMFDQGFITESELETSLAEGYEAPPEKEKNTMHNAYSYAVIEEAGRILGISEKDLITGGYTIETYCDREKQEQCERICASNNIKIGSEDRTIIFTDNHTHGVSAYCSSVSDSPFTFRRQPASIIKPFVAYAPALESGLCAPGSPILDERCDFDGYSPKNYQNVYHGWVTVREALSQSFNLPAVKLMQTVGVDNAKKFAEKFGLSFDRCDDLATALGGMTYGVTPIEVVKAYSTLANGGICSDITFVKRIINSNGVEVYTHTPLLSRAVSEETSYLITDMLLDCAKNGTSKKLSKYNYQLCAKTGTNGSPDGNSDAWSVSYTSEHTLCVWYGSKNAKMPINVTGGSYPTLVASAVWESLEKKPLDFAVPDGIVSADIDVYALNNSHIMELASDSTPFEYRKSELMNAKFVPSYSDYFDNALPVDFRIQNVDNELILSLTASDKFIYRISERSLGVVAEVQKGAGLTEIVLPATFGLKSYIVTAYTPDGVMIAETKPRFVIVW